MFRSTLANPAQKRTIRPIYAQHQATTWGGFLDPNWGRTFDILPGTVMCRLHDEVFTPFTTTSGTPTLPSANARPVGLAALFVAPSMGIDEVTATGTNLFTVWVGGEQAVFEILAPAFDTTAPWSATQVTDGGIQLLTANATGQLTPVGANNANAIAELVSVESVNKILIRLIRNNFTSASAAGSS